MYTYTYTYTIIHYTYGLNIHPDTDPGDIKVGSFCGKNRF